MKNSQIVCLAIFFSALAIALEAGSAAGSKYSVLFSSGRNDNQEIYIPASRKFRAPEPDKASGQGSLPGRVARRGKIAFLSDRGGNMDIYTMAMNGSDVRQLTSTPRMRNTPSSARTGNTSSCSRDFEQKNRDLDHGRGWSDSQRLTSNSARDENAMWSPDGRSLIFQSVRNSDSGLPGGPRRRQSRAPDR